ncbi:UDP-N-acetylglucosamine transferase subunit ALG14 homolog [Anoplophora glabripennis]|uniref:UDP-N-acetylglucosamine transferase subunit ALG14 homolog n=1 Tax=Anoplophora glabripennis TaxID=217634 RepID=UPI0008750775|nr:UDP-N-acetylglucosamine transferase subunit ALG14 homolog [Anoplophora glabripennis]
MDNQLKFELLILILTLVIARVLFLIHKITTGHSKYATGRRQKSCKSIICIGSGGHTTEMLKLIETLDFIKYSPRYYIIASNDVTSARKVEDLEHIKRKYIRKEPDYRIYRIPRSRDVKQSYITSTFTTLYSILYSIPLVLQTMPDLILCNGPGTCIPICGLAFLLKIIYIADTRVVFIESFCRTKTFSLTGRILMYFADNFLVQWPSLKRKLRRSEYIGQLM